MWHKLQTGGFFMQQTDYNKEREQNALFSLAKKEDLVAKKASIHAKLLIEPNLAKEMEEVAFLHEKRKDLLLKLATGKEINKKKEGGMYEMTEGIEE